MVVGAGRSGCWPITGRACASWAGSMRGDALRHRPRCGHRSCRHNRRRLAVDEVVDRDVAVDRGDVGHMGDIDLPKVAVARPVPGMERLARPERHPADPAAGQCRADADADRRADADERHQRRCDTPVVQGRRTSRRHPAPAAADRRPIVRSGTARSPRAQLSTQVQPHGCDIGPATVPVRHPVGLHLADTRPGRIAGCPPRCRIPPGPRHPASPPPPAAARRRAAAAAARCRASL